MCVEPVWMGWFSACVNVNYSLFFFFVFFRIFLSVYGDTPYRLQTRPGLGWWVLPLTFHPATRVPVPPRCWWTALCATLCPPTARTWRAPVYGFMSRRTTWTWSFPAQPWRVLRSLWRSRFSRRFLCKVCRFCCRCCRSCWYIPVPAKRGLLMSKNAAGMVVGRVVASWHTLFFFFLP